MNCTDCIHNQEDTYESMTATISDLKRELEVCKNNIKTQRIELIKLRAIKRTIEIVYGKEFDECLASIELEEPLPFV